MVQQKNYVVYKVDPSDYDLSGDINFSKNSHGRFFMNCELMVSEGTVIFKNADDLSIKGVFSLNKYFVLEYIDR